jgi:tetratricopeptide (TPR) repeat protein
MFKPITVKKEDQMRTIKRNLYILGIILMAVPLNLSAQVKEIPITTSSREALKFFLDGRTKAEDIEVVSAASLFDKAIQKDPGFALAYLYRSQSGGGIETFRKNLDKAIGLIGKVSKGEKLLIQYYQANDAGNNEKQEEYLDQLLKMYPADKRVQVLAGNHYYFLNDYSKARSHFLLAAKIDKNYAISYNMLGYCQSALENYPEAEKAFRNYIRLKPNSPNPYDSYAELLLKMGKYDESIVQYKKAVEKDPVNFAGSLAGVGNNYIFKGDYASAQKYYQEYYDKSATLDGKFNALYLKATAFVYEGDVKKAAAVFEEIRVLAEKENRPAQAIMSYASIGQIMNESGNASEGMKYYEKAIDLIGKANLPETAKNRFTTYSTMWRVYGLTALGQLDKAKAEADISKQKVESRKNYVEEKMLYGTLAYLEVKSGDYDKAIQYFSKADAEDPLNLYYSAVAYDKKGDKEKAGKIYSMIAKSNVNSLNLALVRKRALDKLKK